VNVDTLQQSQDLEQNDTVFSGSASIAIDTEQWQLNLAEDWQLTSQYARMDDIEFPHGLSIKASEPTRVTNTFNLESNVYSQTSTDAKQASSDSLMLEKTLLKIKIPMVMSTSEPQGVGDIDAVLQINKVQLDQEQWSADGSLSIPKLTMFDSSTQSLATPSKELNNDATNLPLANFEQSFEFANNVLTSRGSVDSIERDLHLTTVSKHDLQQQRGETSFAFKTIDFENTERLNQLTSPMVLPVKLVTGELTLSGKARWARKRDEWQATVDVDTQLINIGGAYDETYFSGINGKSSLQVYPDMVSKKTQRLSIDHIDAGVVNTDTVVEFTLTPSTLGDLPKVRLLHANTQLLQGSMSLKPGTYDLNRAQHRLQVVMENINLSEIVRLQQLDDIEATGLVSGQLPILVNNGEVSIDNGQLQAIDPGGILRYQADAAALSANKYAETVMLALSNFNYQALRADTHYDPDGTLLLKLQLQGHNPDLEQGRQVNLNINLEQNVLKLFESVRLVEGVSDTLDKRVQDFYQRTTSQ
jgi:hypothetical protein